MKTNSNRLIAIFIPSLRGGGAERAMLQFADGLCKLNHAVDLIVATAEGPLKEQISSKIKLIDLKCGRTACAILPLRAYLKANKPEAFFSTIPHANLIAIFARMLAGTDCPLIVRESNSPITEKKASLGRRLVHKLVPYLYPKADGVIAVSEGVAEQLRKLERRPGNFNIRVLATPSISEQLLIDAALPITDNWLQKTEGKIIIGCGRLVAAKGFDVLIQAFSLVSATIKSRLVILGDGPEKSELSSLIAQLNLSEKVYMPGFLQNPFAWFSTADVFVLSSRFEGMPNVLIQALALGTAVVSTDCKSGPRECLREGQLGKLVPVDDIQAMADAIITTLNDSDIKTNPQNIRDQYSTTTAAAAYLDFALNP